MSHTRFLALNLCLAALALAGMGFHRLQNRGALIGGGIAPVKSAWLVYALSQFFILPGFLLMASSLPLAERLLLGMVFWSFVLRAPLEGWLLYVVRGWRCAYGITHDLCCLVLAAVGGALALARGAGGRAPAAGFALLAITLACEAFFAWRFSRLASPNDGVYFAAAVPRFAAVNRMTALALAVLLPATAAYLLLLRRSLP